VRAAGPAHFGVAAVGAGLLAAATVPGGELGLGAALACTGMAVAVASARPRRWTLWSVGMALAAVGLAGMVAIRDADWLIAIDLLAALALGSLAVAARGEGFGALARGTTAVLGRLGAATPFVARSVARATPAMPARRLVPALRGLAFGGVLLAVFGGLFASADPAFARLVPDVIPEWDLSLVPGQVLTFGLAVALSGALVLAGPAYGWARPVPPGRIPAIDLRAVRSERGTRRLSPVEWGVPLVLLNGLFAAFVALQAAALVAGDDRVLATAGLTYAEHAREGFGQLVAAAALTLGVIAISMRLAERGRGHQSLWLRLLLGGLCVATLAILASALHRLGLYEEAFGYTRARVAGHAFALWLGGVFVLLLVAGAARGGAWLPRATVALSALALLGLNAANPDGLVAAGNVERFERTGKLDGDYIAGLSADAAPAVARLPADVAACRIVSPGYEPGSPDGWSSANLGRWRARRALRAPSSTSDRACPSDTRPWPAHDR